MISVPGGVNFVLSLLSVALLKFLETREEMEAPFLVFVAGVASCFILVPVVLWLVVRAYPSANQFYFYVFTVFAFTAVIDLVLALTLDGYTPMLNFYLENGEPYLKSPHGCAINYWDGTFHYLLYLVMANRMALGQDFRNLGMIWFGSIMNSLIVFLPGNLLGFHGGSCKPSYFLNVPYLLFPFTFLVKELRKTPVRRPSERDAVSIWKRPLDLVTIMSLIALVGVTWWRTFVAFKSPFTPLFEKYGREVEPYLYDPSSYPQLQVLGYVYYYQIFWVAAAGYLWQYKGTSHQWMRDWAAVALGGCLQGQFSYIFGSLHRLEGYPTPDWTPVPDAGLPMFLAVNGFIVAAHLLLAKQCGVW